MLIADVVHVAPIFCRLVCGFFRDWLPCPSDIGALSSCMVLRFHVQSLFYGESQAIWSYLCGEENLVPHAVGCLEFSFHEVLLEGSGHNCF